MLFSRIAVGKNYIGAPKIQNNIQLSRYSYCTASLNNSVTLGRITKTKLSKYAGFSQIKWDLEKKMCTKRSLM